MEVSLAGGSYENEAPALIAQQSVNMFPELIEARGRSRAQMRRSPGLTTSLAGLTGTCRALIEVNGFIYGVFGEVLYRWSDGGLLSTSPNTP